MHRILTLLIFMVVLSVSAQKETKYTISGYVKDGSNGESLMSSIVYVNEISKGTTTNEYGFYSLQLPPGKYTIKISYVGYTTQLLPVTLDKDTKLNVEMGNSSVLSQEVVVTAERKDANVSSTNIGRQEITMENAKAIPALLGEVDILKTLQLLPGVQAAGEGNSGFYVRGGGPDQNLVLLDEATVYNTGHLFGFFSVFNSDAIKSVTIEKGSMPANYGGRISSVVDVKMKEGNMKKWTAEGGIGIIASRLTVQGPLKKNKCSIMLSGRRTYIDLFTKEILKKVQDGKFAGNSYYFYDINAKINYRFSDKDRIYISGYFGRDVFKFKDPDGQFSLDFPWGNSTVTARWNHVFDEKLFMNTSLVYNDYRFAANIKFLDVKFDVKSSIQQISAKIDYDYSPIIGHLMKFGIHYNHHIFTPYTATGSDGTNSFKNSNANKKYAHETAIYFLDEFDVTKWFRLNIGLRGSMFNLVGPYKKIEFNENGSVKDTIQFALDQVVKTYFGIEPRIGMRFQVAKATSIKAGFHMTKQYVHLVPVSNSTLPTDLWVPSSPNVKPQTGMQYSLGVFQNFKDNMIETSVELYYKDLFNLIENGQSAVGNINYDVEDLYTYGRGRAYGSEFFVKKAKGRWTGWIGYTLAWSTRTFPGIDNGKTFPSKYDRRHDLNVVLMWDISKHWRVSSTFVYASGNTTTLPVAIYYVGGNIHYEWGDRNSWRLPAYHRLDLGVSYMVQKKKWSYDINFSIYNVYNRQNPYFVYLAIKGEPGKGNQQPVLKQSSLFPILPSLTWNFKF
ncbi:MAG: TonB-dependent receptor [Chitinophagales bacterium]|nr:TonB-dependent receptor [Chitinophagales bacterium]